MVVLVDALDQDPAQVSVAERNQVEESGLDGPHFLSGSE